MSTDGSMLLPFEYWVSEAHKNPEAKELAARLKLDMPCGEMRGFKAGLVYVHCVFV
jgi:hypothetical protein